MEPLMRKNAPGLPQRLRAEGYLRQAELLKRLHTRLCRHPMAQRTRRVLSSPVKLSQRVTAWRIADLRSWINFLA
jgi:hypothetical protein